MKQHRQWDFISYRGGEDLSRPECVLPSCVAVRKMAASLRFSVFQCLIAVFLWMLVTCVHSQLTCIEVRDTYIGKGFHEEEMPLYAVNGANLDICPLGESCCSRVMEDKLVSLSRKEHTRQLDEAFRLLKTVFASRTKKFDQFFTELLDNARHDLHEMFVRTYGLLYQQNSAMFADLFNDLRAYYKGKDRNLVDVMDSFFSRLLQKMFELINSQYEFDEDYLTCVTDKMNDLKPFGDVPVKLSAQVKRAFIAARTFVQGLAIGRDVILSVTEIPPTEACVKGLVKMSHCPKCRGLTKTKPCNNYCLNTMKGCFAHHAELNAVWNQYIEALKNLAKRLEGPFNIESVVDPIDVKISDAIMNMHDNSEQVSKQIFAVCGHPRLAPSPARTKRQASPQAPYTVPTSDNSNGGDSATGSRSSSGDPSSPDFYDIENHNKPSKARPTTAAGTSLDRLVRDIKDKVKTAKDFWVQLPYNICNDEDFAAKPDSEDDCWNGQDRAKYVPDVQKDGVMNQINNPEVEVDITKANTMFTRQLVQLRLITSRLQNAYLGEDVDWIDTEIEGVSGSGSGDNGGGSGSGSGFITEDNRVGIVDIDDSQPPVVTNLDKPIKGVGTRKPSKAPTNQRPNTPARDRPATSPGVSSKTPGSGSAVHTSSWTLCVFAFVGLVRWLIVF